MVVAGRRGAGARAKDKAGKQSGVGEVNGGAEGATRARRLKRRPCSQLSLSSSGWSLFWRPVTLTHSLVFTCLVNEFVCKNDDYSWAMRMGLQRRFRRLPQQVQQVAVGPATGNPCSPQH